MNELNFSYDETMVEYTKELYMFKPDDCLSMCDKCELKACRLHRSDKGTFPVSLCRCTSGERRDRETGYWLMLFRPAGTYDVNNVSGSLACVDNRSEFEKDVANLILG